jgi:hypothetical protein
MISCRAGCELARNTSDACYSGSCDCVKLKEDATIFTNFPPPSPRGAQDVTHSTAARLCHMFDCLRLIYKLIWSRPSVRKSQGPNCSEGWCDGEVRVASNGGCVRVNAPSLLVVSGRSPVGVYAAISSNLTENFPDFPQSLEATGLGQGRLLPNYFQFIFNLAFCHSAVYNLAAESIIKHITHIRNGDQGESILVLETVETSIKFVAVQPISGENTPIYCDIFAENENCVVREKQLLPNCSETIFVSRQRSRNGTTSFTRQRLG